MKGNLLSRIVHRLICVLSVALLLICNQALAHKPSDSYLTIDLQTPQPEIRWDIALIDLEAIIGIDSNFDRRITWGELLNKKSDILFYFKNRLAVQSDEANCLLQSKSYQLAKHSDGTYLSLAFNGQCTTPLKQLSINYHLLFERDPTHRGLLKLVGKNDTQLYVLGPKKTQRVFAIDAHNKTINQLTDFINEGIWHIWIGYDHIVFIFTLLLPIIVLPLLLNKQQKSQRLINIIKIVSAFTLAHSITLAMASLQWVVLPTNWVEIAIAASISLVAIHNIRPYLPGAQWHIAFCLGLLHGFGFASVLLDLGASDANLFIALLGFNIGVEIGQIILVIGFVMFFTVYSRLMRLPQHTVTYGSLMAATVGVYWIIQRI